MRKIITSFLFLIIVLSVLAGCDTTTTAPLTTIFPEELSDRGTVAVDETIYLNAGLSGQIESMVVVSRMQNVEKGKYTQYGNFLATQNLTETLPILIASDHLEVSVTKATSDFYYRAELSPGYQPPFLLAIDYQKEGESINPLIDRGAEGTYNIILDVQSNPNALPAFQDHYMCTLQISFSAEGTAVLDANGGSVVLAGGSFTVAFMTLPGASDHFVLALETTSFSISAIQASFLPFDAAMMGEEIGGFGTGLQNLVDGLESLRDGQLALKSGLTEFSDSLSAISTGASQSTEGLSELSAGLSLLYSSVDMLSSNLSELSTAMNQLAISGAGIMNGYGSLMTSITDVTSTFSALHSEEPELLTKLFTLSQTASAIHSALQTYIDGITSCAQSLSIISGGLTQSMISLNSIADGLAELLTGTSSLSEGLESLSAASAEIPESMQPMIDAQNIMIESLSESLLEMDFLFSETTLPVSFASPTNPAPHSIQFVYLILDF